MTSEGCCEGHGHYSNCQYVVRMKPQGSSWRRLYQTYLVLTRTPDLLVAGSVLCRVVSLTLLVGEDDMSKD